MTDPEFLVAPLMKETPARADDAMARGEVANRLQQLHGDAPKDDVRYRLPRAMTAEQFLEHMIHRGALQDNYDKKLDCQIPGFRKWLIEQGDEDPVHQTFWLGRPGDSSNVSAGRTNQEA